MRYAEMLLPTVFSAALALLALPSAACLFRPTASDPPGWRAVHRSVFRQTADFGPQVAHVFADGRRALVADNAWENRRLFLINLETEQVSPLDLPNPGQCSIRRFVYGEDAVYAVFSEAGSDRSAALRIDREGRVTPLPVLSRCTMHADDRPVPFADDLAAAAERGQLDDLVELRTLIGRKSADGSGYTVTGEDRVHHFVNSATLVVSNIAADLELLRGHCRAVIEDEPARRDPPPAGDPAIVVERVAPRDSSVSEADGRVLRLTASWGGRQATVWEARNTQDFYYWVCRVGSRLYLVGTSVIAFDLTALTSAPPPDNPGD